MDRRKSLVLERFKQNPSESAEFLQQEIADIATAFMMEVDEATKQLLTLADINPDNVTVEEAGEVKSLLTKRGINLENLMHPHYPLRLFIRAMYKQTDFLVGYLIWIDLQLNVIRRVRIDNETEHKAALIFLNGGMENYGTEN